MAEVVSAVGDEFTLAHPLEPADAKTTMAVLGGNAIYLTGNLLFKWTIVGKVSYSQLASIAALGAMALVADYLTPLVVMTTASLVLVVLVMVESFSLRLRKPPEGDSRRPTQNLSVEARASQRRCAARKPSGLM